MSRAFVNEDAGGEPSARHRYPLPPRDDPGYDAAAARALLKGADVGDKLGAEEATGYNWGEPKLELHVERLLEDARANGDDRLEQLAERYLRQLRPG
ncbi:MAG: hypothetical protein O7E49_10530 [Gemmatimonadetes bacterium]|nr:hypothetical protein [Gemmatimonadota bacterium]